MATSEVRLKPLQLSDVQGTVVNEGRCGADPVVYWVRQPSYAWMLEISARLILSLIKECSVIYSVSPAKVKMQC